MTKILSNDEGSCEKKRKAIVQAESKGDTDTPHQRPEEEAQDNTVCCLNPKSLLLSVWSEVFVDG